MRFWDRLTNLGDPFMTLPLACLVLLWLAASHRRRIVMVWAIFLALASLLVGVTKFAYAGWHIQIRQWHFTVVSGHTMLSTAVYPLLGCMTLRTLGRWGAATGAAGGFLLALAIGVSRVMIGVHSSSEVIAGWLLGSLVSGAVLVALARYAKEPPAAPALFVSMSLMLALVCYGHVAPIQTWIVESAPALSHLLSQTL